MAYNPNKKLTTYVCIHCGKQFATYSPAKTCSSKCSAAYAFGFRKKKPLSVYEAYRGLCV